MNLLEVFMSPTCLTPVNVVWIWSFNFVFLLHLLRSVEQMSTFLCPTVASFCSALPHVTGCSLTILQHMLPSPVWSFKRQRGALYWFSFGEGREAHTSTNTLLGLLWPDGQFLTYCPTSVSFSVDNFHCSHVREASLWFLTEALCSLDSLAIGCTLISQLSALEINVATPTWQPNPITLEKRVTKALWLDNPGLGRRACDPLLWIGNDVNILHMVACVLGIRVCVPPKARGAIWRSSCTPALMAGGEGGKSQKQHYPPPGANLSMLPFLALFPNPLCQTSACLLGCHAVALSIKPHIFPTQ